MIKSIIAIVNQMQAEGIIGKYAMGGATAAIFYLEPRFTEDIDVFIHMELSENGLLLGLGPIYTYLISKHNARLKGEYVVVDEWPIQFLPPPTKLAEDALNKAIQVDVDGEPLWIFTAEHLAAIALETGRSKDKLRVNEFIEASEERFNRQRFMDLVGQFGLTDKWHRFQEQFLGG